MTNNYIQTRRLHSNRWPSLLWP